MMQQHQQGLSLIELLIFIIVVSVGVVGILSVFNLTVKTSADPVVRKQAITVAEAMLDEVLAKDFTAGGYSGTDRAQFDDVSDYAGYTQSGIKAIDGSAISGLESYSVTVTVDATTATIGAVGAPNTKSVTVSVTGGGNAVTLIGYRMNYE